jgi:hypothetical protein
MMGSLRPNNKFLTAFEKSKVTAILDSICTDKGQLRFFPTHFLLNLFERQAALRIF